MSSTTDSSSGGLQEWSGLSTNHLVIIISVYTVVVIVCLCLINLRYRKRKSTLKHLPRTFLPIRSENISQKQRNVILSELARSNSTRVDPELNLSEGYLGYGITENDNGEKQTIHFKSAIASSSWILEVVASKLQSKLKRKPTMNLRDYVQYLQKHCSQLDPDLCQFYVETYEKARFSTQEFTEEDYIHFMEAFHKLLKSFKT